MNEISSNRKWLRLFLIAMALVLSSLLVWNRIHRSQQLVQSLHPQRLKVSNQDVRRATSGLGTFRTVQFSTQDGLTLRGWYKPSETGAVVIFVHGGGNNRSWFLPEAQELVKRGMGVLLYDSRACGDSDGDLQSWGYFEQKDVTAALDFVTTLPDVDRHRIGIEGFSIGATTAALTAAKDARIHSVVLNALWSSLHDELTKKSPTPKMLTSPWIVDQFTKAGVTVDQVKPIDVISSIAPRDLLIIESSKDTDTPHEVARAVFAAAKEGHKDFYLVQGGDHGQYLKFGGDHYLQRVGDFFSKTL